MYMSQVPTAATADSAGISGGGALGAVMVTCQGAIEVQLMVVT